MHIFYRVRIIPALPDDCISKDDLRLLAKWGFFPEREDKDKGTIMFMAPVYVYNDGDKKYDFVDDEGSFELPMDGVSLYATLSRIMEKANLDYILLTGVDQLIYKKTFPDKDGI